MSTSPQAADADPPSMGEGKPTLARRVSGWTSNLLASGIVLVAALGVGRQLAQWWRVDPSSTPGENRAQSPGQLGDRGEQPFQLTFGVNGYSLKRIEVPSDLTTAIERLKDECRAILEHAEHPSQPVGDAEQRFLDRMAGRPALEERAGQWQIFQFDGKLPLLVGVRADGRSTPRVLAWGLAVPSEEEACSLLVYQAAGSVGGGSSPSQEFPLPNGIRQTLMLSGRPGEATIGLASDFSPRRCTSELDRSLEAHGWKSTQWRQAGGTWHNRYQKTDHKDHLTAQLSEDGRGGTVGLLNILEASN